MGYQNSTNMSTATPSEEVDVATVEQAAECKETPKQVKEYDSNKLYTSFNRDDEVGAGSFSIVIRCRHEELGAVVVKYFKGLTGSSSGIERNRQQAMQEAHKLFSIKHENIVEILGVTPLPDNYGIIMKEIKGGNLEDLLFDQNIDPISWEIRSRIIVEITEALIYLHSEDRQDSKKPCIHGDLKPQNVLLTVKGVVKIADFGSAEFARSTGASRSSINVGCKQCTPFYAAPECFDGERSCASDIYSLGMILYEVLTRRRVYEEVDPRHFRLMAGILKRPKMDKVDDIELKLEGCNLKIFQGLKRIMVKCWNVTVAERLNASQVGGHIDDVMKSVSLKRQDLATFPMPREFRMNAKRKCDSGAEGVQIPLCKRNAVLYCSTNDELETEQRKQNELSEEGTILLIKKGGLLKFDTKDKKLTELQGSGDLYGSLVKNDKEVYIVDCKSSPQTIEKLQVDGDQWSTEKIFSHLGQERSHTAFATYENFLFVVGGSLCTGKKVCTGKQYDFETGQWKTIRDMKSNRSGHALVEVKGYLYAIGGYEICSAERFDADPEAEYANWEEMRAMSHERYGLAVVAMNGKIYAIGGCDNHKGRNLDSVEVYDTDKDTWEKGVSMSEERCWHGACRVGQKIYVAGGESNVIESYNPKTNQWNREAADKAFKGVHSMISI